MSANNVKNVLVDLKKHIVEFCDEHGVNEDTHFSPVTTDSHPVHNSAARKFRILAEPMTDFIGDLVRGINGMPSDARDYINGLTPSSNTGSVATNLTIKCPIIWSEGKKNAIYFPNLESPIVALFRELRSTGLSDIYLGKDNHSRKEYVKSLKAENALLPMYSSGIARNISMDLQDEAKCKKWLPLHRGIRTLARRHEVTLERALSRCVLWKGKLLSEGDRGSWIIEVLADTIRAFGKPPIVSIAESLDGFVDMYHLTRGESPGSCMDSTHNFYKMIRPDGKEGRPVDWYHFCPIVKGYYLHRGAVVLARAMAYEYEGRKFFCRVYGASQANRGKLVDKLKQDGYTSHDSKFPLSKNVIFHIPNYKVREVQGIPVPYFDWTPFTQLYVKQTRNGWDVCLRGQGDKLPKDFTPISMTSTSGVYTSDDRYDEDDDTRYCHYCEEPIDIEGDYYECPDDEYYCSSACRSADGVWRTYNMSDDYRYAWDTCSHYTGFVSQGNQIAHRPSGEPDFIHEYITDDKDMNQIRCEISSPHVTFYDYRQGFANRFVAIHRGFLLSMYSFAVSEDEHWICPEAAYFSWECIREQRRKPYTLHKGEPFAVEWRYVATEYPNKLSIDGLSDYIIPDNSRRKYHKSNTQLDELVTNYHHIEPVVIPIGEVDDKLDFSKPFPILDKDAMRNLSGVDVDAIISAHIHEVYSWLSGGSNYDVHYTIQDINNYLNPIISEENTNE